MNRRNTKELKVWMIRNNLRQIDIIKATGEEQTYVNKTILGLKNNRAVLRYLFYKGCPAEYLALPDDLLKELPSLCETACSSLPE